MSIVTDEMVRLARNAYAEEMNYNPDIVPEKALRAAIEAALRAMWRPVAHAPEGIEVFYAGGMRDGKWAQVPFNGILLKQALDPATPAHLRASWITHFAPPLPPPEGV